MDRMVRDVRAFRVGTIQIYRARMDPKDFRELAVRISKAVGGFRLRQTTAESPLSA